MKLLLTLTVSMFSVALWASTEFTPLQERAQGESLIGGNLLNDSLHSNPASSAFTQIYAVEGIYGGPQTFGVSVLDTRTSNVGGALGYFRSDSTFSDDPLHGVKLGLSGRLSPTVALGLTGKILWGEGVNQQSENAKDADLGILANLGTLSLGAVLRNVFGGNEQFALRREYGAGARIDYRQTLFLSFAFMGEINDPNPYQYGIGTEYVSPYHFSLKGGYRIQPRNDLSYWSTGVSLNSPRVSVHYVLEIPNQSEESLEHTLGVTMLL